MKQKTILIICPYPEGTVPGQRLKYEQYFNDFRESGYCIKVAPFFFDEFYRILYTKGLVLTKAVFFIVAVIRRFFLLPSIARADGIYVFLSVVPVGPILLDFLYISFAKKVVYDIDDMVHSRAKSTGLIGSIYHNRSRYSLLLRRSDYVITCTPYLYRMARKFNKNVVDISSSVDTKRFVPVNKYSNRTPVILGWSGSHSTEAYLDSIKGVLSFILERYDASFLIMGGGSFQLPGLPVYHVPWSDAAEVETFGRIDIGLYPLTNDHWVKGKSGLKAIQYMAMGLPVVASDYGCTSRVVIDGVTGFLVQSEDQWCSALVQLIENPDLRMRLGRQARTRVVEHFSLEANRAAYLGVVRSVFS